jgi:hypothetical protein
MGGKFSDQGRTDHKAMVLKGLRVGLLAVSRAGHLVFVVRIAAESAEYPTIGGYE